jgi:hypothetical protein
MPELGLMSVFIWLIVCGPFGGATGAAGAGALWAASWALAAASWAMVVETLPEVAFCPESIRKMGVRFLSLQLNVL